MILVDNMYEVTAKNLEINGREHKVDLEIKKDGEKLTEKRFTCSKHQFENKREHLFISVSMIELENLGKENFDADYNVDDFKEEGRVNLNQNFEYSGT